MADERLVKGRRCSNPVPDGTAVRPEEALGDRAGKSGLNYSRKPRA